jgi:VacB/RNase II family 3'-5' exoribonuclease
MPNTPDLQAIARQVMLARGFHPDFPAEVQQQVHELNHRPPAITTGNSIRDLRNLLWSSIDNDTSRDLDQVEVAEPLPNGATKIMVAIADIDSSVAKGSPIDVHAASETTTVYAGVKNFPMLPEQLSTGMTSLLENQDRLSVVIEFVVDDAGNVSADNAYPALTRNHAQLQYNSMGAWLENTGSAPAKVAASAALQQQLRIQDATAQKLKNQRHQRGSLELETSELTAIMQNNQVVGLVPEQRNHATELIEEFMVAANGVMARRLEKVSSLRRVVKTPERWDRIVQLATDHGEKLPPDPDSKALSEFLLRRKAADPDRFADLSLAVVKLIGPGEYVLERPGDPAPGHFGLAVQDYTHSTAPNRRFADMVTQRIVKAQLAGKSNPFSDDELAGIATNCTEKEKAARKVERDMSKRLAAVALQNRIGALFDAIVTGVKPHATFVRSLQPHVEGLLAQGAKGLDIGDRLKVKLIRVDVPRGFIDFARA